jgi:Na+/H+ antiporter NhaC
MVFLLILLVFAWAIGGICSELDTGGYVASLFSGTMPAFMAPFLVFLFSCITAFATGASFGTYAIMMPVAIPLAVALNADVYACIAAVIGGGGFGNHCSPLADTAILSSAGANIRHIDHIKTQIPYSVTCAAVAGISYILAGVLKNPVIPMIACFGLFILAVVVLHKLFGSSKYELDELEDTGNLVGALSESAK